MAPSLNLTYFAETGAALWAYLQQQMLSGAMAVQLVVIGGAILVARLVIRHIQTWFGRLREHGQPTVGVPVDMGLLENFKKVIGAFSASLLVWVAHGVARHYHWPRDGLYIAGIILLALALKRLLTETMANRFWAGVIVGAIWTWAALYVANLIDHWTLFLDRIAILFGQIRISLLHLAQALPYFLILYWLSKNLSAIWRLWLTTSSGLTPAVQILLARLGSIFLYTLSIVLLLHYLGLDFTVFALFSGALGLGLGFGLQKIFANLVSGFILLADKSIKPGDVIQLKDTYGWINFLGTRYCSVVTRDGIEHLIPNENLITGEVINWSYSEDLVRLKVPVGVAYGTDLEKAERLMLEAAADTRRVLQNPRPVCHLIGLGDNAINLDLRIWINDPRNGLTNVKSELLRGIWRRFQENGIEVPYPQRDVRLKTVPDILVRTGQEKC